ncbi:RING-H2 finger protein ATL22-like [Prunus avium]|uniref:RING-type E3 ubiquitin transferase n=1 Tax=Prunus avium TaxID=42229 RepID=A0A6P5SWW8_PRUAV|nr:RING-H2 finger protein ATL22-like [Prunus avium]
MTPWGNNPGSATARGLTRSDNTKEVEEQHALPMPHPFDSLSFSKITNPLIAGVQGLISSHASCNNQKQTIILTLPSSEDFIVQNINYKDQRVTVNNPNNCLPRRFLKHDFNLTDSPFDFATGTENYTFLNCSYKDVEWASPITCLSNDQYKVLLEPTSSESWAPCSVISTALVPYYSFDWYDLNEVGVELEWEVPDCRSWEARNLHCGLETPTSSPAQGFDHSSKFWLLGIIGIVFYVSDKIRAHALLQQQQPTTDMSINITDGQPPVAVSSLADAIIESYRKIELGETWELL